MKGCSTLLVLREIEIKSTVEYHFALEISVHCGGCTIGKNGLAVPYRVKFTHAHDHKI